MLSNEGLHPYHLLKVQHLLPEDYGCRDKFSQWIIEHRNLNRFILYTDECPFTRHSFSNIHNDDLWAEENPHATVAKSFQDRFKANVRCGLVVIVSLALISLTNHFDLEFRKNLIYMQDAVLLHSYNTFTIIHNLLLSRCAL